MLLVLACWRYEGAMARIVFAQGYFDSIDQITSRRLEGRLLDLLDLIAAVPTFGSRKVRGLLERRFGKGCMTAGLSSFLLVFEYVDEADTVYVYGVVRQRSIR